MAFPAKAAILAKMAKNPNYTEIVERCRRMMAALVAEAPERVVYPRRAAMVEAGAERAVLEEDLAYQRRAGECSFCARRGSTAVTDSGRSR